MEFEDILYEVRNGVAWITINRPDKMNSFRGQTCDEIIKAMNRAGYDRGVGAIVLAGAGDRAFCTGGDQSAHNGNYDGRGTIGLPMEELHDTIRNVPKPVIARVQGFAIGGGNVLCTICDLTIASEKALFGQVGPKMGSVDPGYGTAFLARVVGEKKAREIWYLNRRYSGAEAVAMGLANAVVYLKRRPASVHPDLERKPPPPFELVSRGYLFAPRVFNHTNSQITAMVQMHAGTGFASGCTNTRVMPSASATRQACWPPAPPKHCSV